MKTRLEQALERYLNGREIAIWGNPTRYMLRALKGHKYHIAGQVDPKKHYVVAVTYEDEEVFEMDEQCEQFEYIEDYLAFEEHDGRLPFEWECFEAKIGRHTYFSNALARACRYGEVSSIGHFTAIHETVRIDVNHQMNMTTVNDSIPFNEENMRIRSSILVADPKHPYAQNQAPLTIGSDVWIGANVFINSSNVTSIGDGAVIGTGAVVMKNVPPYAIVVGTPAKIKRYRYAPEMIETLLRIQWWNWSDEQINVNADALFSPEIFMKRFGKR